MIGMGFGGPPKNGFWKLIWCAGLIAILSLPIWLIAKKLFSLL